MKRESVSILTVAALIGAFVPGCAASRALRRVSEPREGRPLNKRVAIVYSSKYQISLGGLERLHPFDIHKYRHIYTQIVKDGLVLPEDVYVPEPISEQEILRVHTPRFLESLRRSGAVAAYLEAPPVAILPAFVVERGLLGPIRHATGGTLLAARKALECGVAINIGGGYHHAKPDAGEGFCVYADIPIAVRALQAEGKIRRVLVVDLDVHQGNGTAVCFSGDGDVFTFSMHQADIYPIPKERSDLDVDLLDGDGDEQVLRLLAEHLPDLFEKAKPDIVFVVAGCDMLDGDPLASLTMTLEGIVERDSKVVDECVRRGAPVVVTLGGGYSADAWRVQYAGIRRIIRTHGLET